MQAFMWACVSFCAESAFEYLSGLLGLSWARMEHSCLKVGAYSHLGTLGHIQEFSMTSEVDADPDT